MLATATNACCAILPHVDRVQCKLQIESLLYSEGVELNLFFKGNLLVKSNLDRMEFERDVQLTTFPETDL